MGDGKWLRQGRRRTRNGKRHTGEKTKRRLNLPASMGDAQLGFEQLEDRRMLAVFLVNNTNDIVNNAVSFGSLRWAINSANADDTRDTILFDENVFVNGLGGGETTITLNGGQLDITQPVDILGPGPRELTVHQGQNNRRVFNIAVGPDDEIFGLQISGMTISGGNLAGTADSQKGGGIYNRDALTMIETVIEGNSASRGGGGIFTQRGSLSLQRSLVIGNSANVGGGIMNGGTAEDDAPTTTISNSTITGNAAFGGPSPPYPLAYGGGLFNRNGTLNIFNSTITENEAAGGLGEGVASWGNPFPDDLMAMPIVIPPPTVFTNVGSSIIWNNGMSDIDKVGKNDDDPPADLLASITSLSFNFVGTGNATTPFMSRFMGEPDTMAFNNPALMSIDSIGVDPLLLLLDDYGGSTDAYILDPTSPAIDVGELFSFDEHDQRGRHFTREFDYTNTGVPTPDVGAFEMQRGTFVVDILRDESDSQFSKIYTETIMFGFPFFDFFDPYDGEGDFSLREAIIFAQKNPETDTIRFADVLRTIEPVTALPSPPTIRLTLGDLDIDESLIIEGPPEYVLEIDASGTDATPAANEGNGTRVFNIDDGNLANFSDVSISNVTIMGADVNVQGGAIFNRENLTLNGVTLKDNAAIDGGALYVYTGTVTIHGTTFKNNHADGGGGAIFVNSFNPNGPSEVTITNSTFSANQSGGSGAGIFNNNANVLIRHSTVTLNSASNFRGSGVWNGTNNALTEIQSSIISGNANQDVEVANGVNPNTIVSLGYNLVGKGNVVTANRFNQTGDKPNVLNPLLGSLLNTGGLVETHRPLGGSQAIDMGPVGLDSPFVITPTTVTSSTAATDAQSAALLIDDSGLSASPTVDNYGTVTHAAASATNSWLTSDPGAPGGDYFAQLTGLPPNLVFELDAMFVLSGMLLWGYVDPANIEHNPFELFVEFSVDGGQTFYTGVDVVHAITEDRPSTVSFGATYAANAVRVTVFDNYFQPPAALGGGNRVGLGEVKFINPFDQRGPDFVRVFDGDLDGTDRMDIGAYELQSSVFTVSNPADENDGNHTVGNLSLREAIQLANDNPLPDEIVWDPGIVGIDVVHGLTGGTAPNTTADMKITADLKITGPGSEYLSLDAGGLIDQLSGLSKRVFTIDDGSASTNIDVVITGLKFEHAAAAQAGGVIHSRENLTLNGVTFSENTTQGDGFSGGAIFMEKPAGAPLGAELLLRITVDDRDPNNIVRSILTGNQTNGVNSDGGAIYARDVNVVIDGYAVIAGNSTLKAQSDGGAVFIKSTISSPPSADFDLDADVDGRDFLTWQRNFDREAATKAEGDANVDTDVDGVDLSQWRLEFGVVGNQGAVLTMGQVNVSGNQTVAGDSDGGGLFSEGSEIILADAVFSGNHTGGSNSEGGGIVVKNSNLTLNRSVVSLNSTSGNQSSGGGVYVISTGGKASTLTLQDSLVSQNFTTGLMAHGGGIAVQDGVAAVRSSTVAQNHVDGAGSHGGGIVNLSGNVTIVDSTIATNLATSATSKGGGIYSDTNLAGTQLTLIFNSTVSGNTGQLRGGGVFNADGLTEIKHSTITNNATSFANLGSGVASQGTSATLTRVQSSIVAGNVGSAAGTHTDIDFVDGALVNSIQSLGFNLIGTGNALGSFSPAIGDQENVLNPGLAPLADNGGPGVFLNPETHALLPGSPANNAGNPAFNPNSFGPPLVNDQRGVGFPRVLLGRIDVGAFESPVFPSEAAIVAGGNSSSAAALTVEPSTPPADNQLAATAAVPSIVAVQPAFRGLTSLAGLGASLSGTHNRLDGPSARPLDLARRLREPEALAARHTVVFDDWRGSSLLDDSSLTETARARDRRAEPSDPTDLSAEDAVFALIGDVFPS